MGNHPSWPPLRGEMKTIPSRAAPETNATSPSPPFQTPVALVAAGRAFLCPNGIHVAVAAQGIPQSARIDTSLCANRGVLPPRAVRAHGERAPASRIAVTNGTNVGAIRTPERATLRGMERDCGGTSCAHLRCAACARHARRAQARPRPSIDAVSWFGVRGLWSTICSNASASAEHFQDDLDVIGRLLIRANR
jgi:hypothetical protein